MNYSVRRFRSFRFLIKICYGFLFSMMCQAESTLYNVAGHTLQHIKNRELPFQIEADHIAGEILVKFRKDIPRTRLTHLHRKADVEVINSFKEIRVDHVRGKRGQSTEELLRAYSQREDIEYAEPNYLQYAHARPNDPRFTELYGLYNLGQTGGIPDADIDATDAWNIQTGDLNTLIAVIDSGIHYLHEDLVENVWTNPHEVLGNGIDDDQNGYIDDIHGWNFVYNNNEPLDYIPHGTHVSGTIAAVGNNGIGVTGVAWRTKIMALSFLHPFAGSGSTSNAAAAILYATHMGAKIANNSWGGTKFSQVILDAISYANDQGMLFVASAGNSNKDVDVVPVYPCSYDLPNIICVAATDSSDGLAQFISSNSGSNYGAASVDLGAPGLDVLSTIPPPEFQCCYDAPDNTGYRLMSGTSMAAPHVSGGAALLLSQFPGLTAVEIKNIIMSSVDTIPSLVGKTVTGGRLNIYNAIQYPRPDLIVSNINVSDVSSAGEDILISYSVYNQGNLAADRTLISFYLVPIQGNQNQGVFLDVDWILPLAAKASFSSIVTLTIPATIPTGDYYILGIADETEMVTELGEFNNSKSSNTFGLADG